MELTPKAKREKRNSENEEDVYFYSCVTIQSRTYAQDNVYEGERCWSHDNIPNNEICTLKLSIFELWATKIIDAIAVRRNLPFEAA